MRKLFFAFAALLLVAVGCTKEEKFVVGDGSVQCTPTELTVKVGEKKTFTYSVSSSVNENQMDWGYTEKPEAKSGSVFADVFKDTKTVEVTGLGVGTKIVYAYVDSGEGTARKILGGVVVTVTE